MAYIDYTLRCWQKGNHEHTMMRGWKHSRVGEKWILRVSLHKTHTTHEHGRRTIGRILPNDERKQEMWKFGAAREYSPKCLMGGFSCSLHNNVQERWVRESSFENRYNTQTHKNTLSLTCVYFSVMYEYDVQTYTHTYTIYTHSLKHPFALSHSHSHAHAPKNVWWKFTWWVCVATC